MSTIIPFPSEPSDDLEGLKGEYEALDEEHRALLESAAERLCLSPKTLFLACIRHFVQEVQINDGALPLHCFRSPETLEKLFDGKKHTPQNVTDICEFLTRPGLELRDPR